MSAAAVEPRQGPTANDTRQIRESARGLESVFLTYLLKTMRRAGAQAPTPGLGGGNRVYVEMMDEELARAVAKGRGIGLADLLVRELTRKNSSSLGPARPMANRQERMTLQEPTP